ncbi:hypothetical protein BDFB_000386, partial [Asbolus verrucosus]
TGSRTEKEQQQTIRTESAGSFRHLRNRECCPPPATRWPIHSARTLRALLHVQLLFRLAEERSG